MTYSEKSVYIMFYSVERILRGNKIILEEHDKIEELNI